MDQYLRVKLIKNRTERQGASLKAEYPEELRSIIPNSCLPAIKSVITYDIGYWNDFYPLDDFMTKYNADHDWGSRGTDGEIYLGNPKAIAETFEKILEDHDLADELFPTDKYEDIDLYTPIYDDDYFNEVKNLATIFRKLADVYDRLNINGTCYIYYQAED